MRKDIATTSGKLADLLDDVALESDEIGEWRCKALLDWISDNRDAVFGCRIKISGVGNTEKGELIVV